MEANMRRVDLNLIPVFLAVVEERNLSRAAEKLAMSQPAVSQALGRLRLTFDDALFIRTRNGMEPTHYALTLYQKLKQATELVALSLPEARRFDPANSDRCFTVSTPNYFNFILMPDLFGRLHPEAPHIRMQVLPDQQDEPEMQLRLGTLDLVIDVLKPEGAGLQHIPLLQEQLVLVMRRDHPRIQHAPQWAEVLAESHIVLHRRHPYLTLMESLGFSRFGQRKVVYEVSNFNDMLPILCQSDLLAVFPRRLAEMCQSHWPIQLQPLPEKIEPIQAWMSWHRSREDDPAHRWLRQQVEGTSDQLMKNMGASN